MSRDFRLYFDDSLEAIHQIRTYMADLDEDAFARDRKTQDAVIRNLEIIGEAAGNLSEQILKTAPEKKSIGAKSKVYEISSSISILGSTSLSSGMWSKANWNFWKQPVKNY